MLGALNGTQFIRECNDADISPIESIINAAAEAYRAVIPPDCWHEPYMSGAELVEEIAAGVRFWGFEQSSRLVGIMGLQGVGDASLIRHAYVRPEYQHQGIGHQLLCALAGQTTGQLLVGTWAAAHWAIRFYQGHGFYMVSEEEKDRLLKTYWTIPLRQRQSSVVLVRG